MTAIARAFLAAPLVAPLHNRMPAIQRPEDYQSWIFKERDVALKAIGPYPAQVMSAQKLGIVSPEVV